MQHDQVSSPRSPSKKCIQVKALVAASRRCRRAVKSRGGDPSCQQCWEGRSRTELNLSLPICRFTRSPPPKFLDKRFSSSATPSCPTPLAAEIVALKAAFINANLVWDFVCMVARRWHGRRGRDLKLFPGERENSFRTKEPFLSSNSAASPGSNHAHGSEPLIYTFESVIYAGSQNEGRSNVAEGESALGNDRAQGKRSGILCGACKRALAGIAPRGWPPRIFRISSCIQILSEAPEGFEFRRRTFQTQAQFVYSNYSGKILPNALRLVSLLRR